MDAVIGRHLKCDPISGRSWQALKPAMSIGGGLKKCDDQGQIPWIKMVVLVGSIQNGQNKFEANRTSPDKPAGVCSQPPS
jgi:hypothetical protein